MCDTMRRDYYWPNMTSNVYKTVSNFRSWDMNSAVPKQKRHVRLFPATIPSELVAINILRSLAKTTKGNRNIVIIIDKFSKLTLAVPTPEITTTAVEWIFFDAWVILYSIPSYQLTDNGTKFVKKNLWDAMYQPRDKARDSDYVSCVD